MYCNRFDLVDDDYVSLIDQMKSPTFDRANYAFFVGLTALVRGNVRLGRRMLKRMRCWAEHSPHTFVDHLLILEAELLFARRKYSAARLKYVQAVRSCKNGMKALAMERMARHLYSLGEWEEAKEAFGQSLELYRAWGAMGKVRLMEAERW